MQMPRPTEADKERFRDLVPMEGNVEVKPMFGQLAAFVNGNMFMGLFGSDVGVKLSPSRPGGRTTGRWRRLRTRRAADGRLCQPARIRRSRAVDEWIASALAYVATLPPKRPKGGKG